MLLFDHTAADSNNQIWIVLLAVLELTNVAKYPVFRVFTHSAGIKDNDIRLVRRIGKTVADLRKHSAQFFPVVHILLAPKRVQHSKWRMVGNAPADAFACKSSIIH